MLNLTRARLAGGFVRSASFNPAMIPNKGGIRVAVKRNFRYASAQLMQDKEKAAYGVLNSDLKDESAPSFEEILKAGQQVSQQSASAGAAGGFKRTTSGTFNPDIVTSL